LLRVDMPGREPLAIRHAVFDLNGTLALDGELLPEIFPRFEAIRSRFHCLVLTQDTFGTAAQVSAALQCDVRTVTRAEEKAAVVRGLSGGVAAIGNGVNDAPMFRAADLAIAVLGPEGLARDALLEADLLVPGIDAALGLLLSERRLRAGLRA